MGLGQGLRGEERGGGPAVTPTVKLWACDLLLELLPVGQPPSVDFEVLDIMAKVGHMLCSKRLVWGVVRKGEIRQGM